MAQPDDALARSGRRVPHAAQPCLDLVVDVGAAAQVEVMGEHRWLTVVSPEHPDGPELVLEPGEHPAARPFEQALVHDGIPFTSFAVHDVQPEDERLTRHGVRFTQQPTAMGPVTTAVLDDTCGNLIQIAAAAAG